MNTRSIAGVAFLSLGMTAVVFAQATDEAATKVDKARRYMSLGMYEEATWSLKDLVVSDEFNADSRYMYGVALEGLGKHREAAEQLELSLRLAPQLWRATIKLPEVYLAAYNESGANVDRKEAYKAALQLIQVYNLPLSSESEKNDLLEAKVTARGMLAKLESPIGVWRSPWGADFSVGMFSSPPRLAMKEVLPKGATSCGHACWGLEIKATSGPDYSASYRIRQCDQLAGTARSTTITSCGLLTPGQH
jgi:tetratricopeptide (TPR) repeat protein